MSSRPRTQRPPRSAAPAKPADNLLALIHVLSNLITRAFYDPLESRHGVTIAEWRIMLSLFRQPGLTAAEIIERWAMEKMAASRAIRSLERRGWIGRRRRSADRRSYALTLTAKGRKACGQVLPDANARYRQVLACLTTAQQRKFERCVLDVIAHVRKIVG